MSTVKCRVISPHRGERLSESPRQHAGLGQHALDREGPRRDGGEAAPLPACCQADPGEDARSAGGSKSRRGVSCSGRAVDACVTCHDLQAVISFVFAQSRLLSQQQDLVGHLAHQRETQLHPPQPGSPPGGQSMTKAGRSGGMPLKIGLAALVLLGGIYGMHSVLGLRSRSARATTHGACTTAARR